LLSHISRLVYHDPDTCLGKSHEKAEDPLHGDILPSSTAHKTIPKSEYCLLIPLRGLSDVEEKLHASVLMG
jgi:hypothetical protein